MKKVYNCYGKDITGIKVKLQSATFGGYNAAGELVVNWPQVSAMVDDCGFDKTHKEPNGQYLMDVELPKGTIVVRYGSNKGYFTAPLGTAFELLGLPYEKSTCEYHQYKVVADGIHVKCVVKRGKVRAAFNSCGGAIQYYHEQSIANELLQHKLEEDFSWLTKEK
ncbi:hypothetical protein bpr_IV050 (plasmid) [Butyrivibrio proteoclasticus B316]|uniref:TNT domain-containing protein n=1 Tax=Butyrivibrio proteoclasticus (strain ATCC 51982 / DSM 14932 / B316) TaxID=515622 RepID=E0S4T3_BUTPB|nr:TNT domain-containing protein [Butyrivibrio proteoclasticus]ADL36415.1 hypothetical protein bpr_IV050 [Butyrivibrio proteoclasticus B316]